MNLNQLFLSGIANIGRSVGGGGRLWGRGRIVLLGHFTNFNLMLEYDTLVNINITLLFFKYIIFCNFG